MPKYKKRVDISARYAKFFQDLRRSPCHEVAVLASIVGRDLRSTTGSNLRLVEESSGLNPWEYSSARVKKELIERGTVEVPVQEHWRVSYLAKLLERRQVADYSGLEEEVEHLTELIESLCVN